MPKYEYTCPSCLEPATRLLPMGRIDEPQVCGLPRGAEICGAELVRQVPSAQVNLADKRWGVKAILGDGRRIPGSFGVGRPRTFKGFM